MPIKTYQNITLPQQLHQELAATTKGVNYRNCLRMLNKIIFADHKREYQSNMSFTPIPQEYFLKVFGRHYNEPLNTLLFGGFVERTDTFGEGKCFEYRISPSYSTDEETVKTKYHYNIRREFEPEYKSMADYQQHFAESFQKLTIPTGKMYQAIEDKVQKLSIRDFVTDDRIDFPFTKMTVNELDENWVFTPIKGVTKKDALLIADQKKKLLVSTGEKLMMVDPDYFIDEQKRFTSMAWENSVDSLCDTDTLYARRNYTNNRLDSNFTNMPGELYKIILNENRMGEADIVNSQPALLAHMMEKEGVKGKDFDLYKELVYNGTFYEYLGKQGTRSQIKAMVFEVLFGTTMMTPNRQRFKDEFPTVWEYTVKCKEEEHNALAIGLQKLESQIFIDGILGSLKSMGIHCFTKHDSVSFFHEDRGAVQMVIDNVLKNHGFKGKVKLEYFA